MVFTVNTLKTLLGATLSQTQISAIPRSNFNYMQDDTSTRFSDCMRSSPWLSCYMSQVPSFLSTKRVFKHMDEINLILYNTHTNAPCVAIANL